MTLDPADLSELSQQGDLDAVEAADPQVADLMRREAVRQATTLEMIASENHVSQAVLQAAGSVLTNKYAEGYPGARYYGGCGFYDQIESLAIERACKLFGCGYANVQPHSGANANLGVMLAILSPGDTFLSLNLASGGHLSHGMKLNVSAKFYNPVHYELGADEQIDFDDVRKKAHEHKPKVILCGYSAYPRTIDFAKFREIADEVGAMLWADVAHIAGLIVGGAHPSPFPHCHVVTTTTHKTLRGPRGGLILCDDEELAKKINRGIFPGSQGGPLMHVVAAKAVAFEEALQPEFKTYAANVVNNAKALAAALKDKGYRLVGGGTDNHLLAHRLARPRRRPDRRRGGRGVGGGGHHQQQERHPQRPAPAEGDQRHPPRHRRPDDARPRRRRHADGRGLHRPGDGRPRRFGGAGVAAAGGGRLRRAVPDAALKRTTGAGPRNRAV